MTRSLPPLILASQSAARRRMLKQVGLGFETAPVAIDEAAIAREGWDAGDSPQQIALSLAQAKAMAVSRIHPGALVIGGDQILMLGHEMLDKATSRADALDRLGEMQGRTHRLHAAASVVLNGEQLWNQADTAELTMRGFNREELERYADRASDALTTCVGYYALEEAGAWLFKKIEGDYFTILGLPLLPLLDFLRDRGYGP